MFFVVCLLVRLVFSTNLKVVITKEMEDAIDFRKHIR